jgi:hypothetical protein
MALQYNSSTVSYFINNTSLPSSSSSGAICVAIVFLLITQRFLSWWNRYGNVPIYGKGDKDMRKALTQGYEKVWICSSR